MIHRDLKPANLMIDVAEGRVSVRILDFGIAIVDQLDFLGNQTGMGVPAGTGPYMAPEQIQGQAVSVSCDLYGVGVIAWEMVMGRPAYSHKTFAQIFVEKMRRADGFTFEGAPVPIPTPFREFIERCTHPDPRVRPTAHEGIVVMNGLDQTSKDTG